MIKIYHGSNVDAINWKIYADNVNNVISYFPTGSSSIDVADRLCQVDLLNLEKDDHIYVVNIDSWKLTDKTTKQNITELHNIEKQIIFVLESATVKNKIFSELKIQTVKATAVTKKAKTSVVSQLLANAKIQLKPDTLDRLIDLLPENINFIKNEINKLQLLGQPTFTTQEIETIIFDMGDATIFNIVDPWLNGNEQLTIERLNDLISKNITIQAFVPIFVLKLVQIKFFLTAKLAKWSSDVITAKLGLPFWQQNMLVGLRPYDKNLERINQTLEKLYEFDINVKKQKNIPYTQLIKILFK